MATKQVQGQTVSSVDGKPVLDPTQNPDPAIVKKNPIIKAEKLRVFIMRKITKDSKKWYCVAKPICNLLNGVTFRFHTREYNCAIEEGAFIDTDGTPVVLFDAEGNKPLKVMIEDIETQKSSKFAGDVYGLKTLQQMFAAMYQGNKVPILLIVLMLGLGTLIGIVIDHFLHI